MKKIYCKNFPTKGYVAIIIICWLFVREEYRNKLPWYINNHEGTHLRQEIELAAIGAVIGLAMLILGSGWWSVLPLFLFYWWYGVEFLLKLPFCRFKVNRAYMSVSLEQEAYAYHFDNTYLERRRYFAWLRFIFKLKTNNYESKFKRSF